MLIIALALTGCVHLSLPNIDGSCPYSYPVKGNADSKLYHIPNSEYYLLTSAELCFDSPEAARKNGFYPPK